MADRIEVLSEPVGHVGETARTLIDPPAALREVTWTIRVGGLDGIIGRSVGASTPPVEHNIPLLTD